MSAASVQAIRLPPQVSIWQQRARQSRLRGLAGRFLSRSQGRCRARPRSVGPQGTLSPALLLQFPVAAAVSDALMQLSFRQTLVRATRPPLHLFSPAAAQSLFVSFSPTQVFPFRLVPVLVLQFSSLLSLAALLLLLPVFSQAPFSLLLARLPPPRR